MPIRANALTGAAGEHYVAYELSRRNCAVGLTRAGCPGVDLMVSNTEGGSAVSIQVKTAEDAHRYRKRDNAHYWCWRVGQKGASSQGGSLFYAFVSLHNPEGQSLPAVFILPSSEVASIIEKGDWDDGWFGIDGPDCEKWRDAWRLITDRLKT